MKIICDNKIPFLRGVLEPFAKVEYLSGPETTPEKVRDADAIITRTRTKCNESLLKGSSVKIIASATIGYDHIDTEWCESNGIIWKNAPGCNSASVKQYISSVLCVLAQKYGLQLSQMTLGVVGVGNVGSKVALAAEALGMKVLLCDPPRSRTEGAEGFVTLEQVIASADIITLHVPLSKEGEDATWHLMDESRLSRLRQSQILINSSRGPVVDNAALKNALSRGAILAAVLDVWEGEPAIDPELVSMLDLATPHIAGYSADGKANGTAASVDNVSACLGLPLKGWRPQNIPAPAQKLEFSLDARGKSTQELLSEAILHCYDVRIDSDALRGDISSFEKLRGEYPIRREPSAFSLRLIGGSDSLLERLRKLDFKRITTY